jgi:hypothetical protein
VEKWSYWYSDYEHLYDAKPPILKTIFKKQRDKLIKI